MNKFYGLFYLLIFTLLLTPNIVFSFGADDFIITVKTDNAGTSSSDQFTIPTVGGGYNYNVDCNDDGVDEFTAQTGDVTCDYSTLGGSGTYTIRIEDNSGGGTGFPRIYFNNTGDKEKILTVEQWGTGIWTSMSRSFYGASNLDVVAPDAPDLSGLIGAFNFRQMFSGATSLVGSTANWNWNTAAVNDLFGTFQGASSFNGDISNWDTGNVTNLTTTFFNTSFNQDISSWDVSNVTTMDSLFFGTPFNQDISNWDTGNVVSMRRMFYDTPFNQPLNSWNVSNVTDMSEMFWLATDFNQPLDNWDVSNVVNFAGTFARSNFNQDISSWDTSRATTMNAMFRQTPFNQDISSWNTSGVTSMRDMFLFASGFNQPIGSWDIGNVTTIRSMFQGTSVFNQPLDNWDTSSITDMSLAFGQSAFNQDLNSWDTSNVTNMNSMFNVSSFNGNIGNWDTSSVTNMRWLFRYTPFNQDISGWDTSSVASMEDIFSNSTDFDQNIASWNVQNVTNFGAHTFNGAGLSTTNYDAILTGWNTQALQPSLTLGVQGLTYCKAEADRQDMVDNDNWTFSGDSKDPSCAPDDPTVAPDLQSASDTGASDTDNVTNDTTPSFDVVCSEAGNGITLYTNNPAANTVAGTHTCAGVGTETATVTNPLSHGSQNITYTDSNGGNESGHSPALTIAVDTIDPAAPIVTTPADNSVTNDITPTITGTAEANSMVTVSIDGTDYTTTTDGSGNWSLDVTTALAEGSYTMSVITTDRSGNDSPATTSSFTVDTTAPATSSPDLVSSSDTGSSDTDNITNDTTPDIEVNCVDGNTVELFAGGISVGTQICAGGTASFTLATLTDGNHDITYTETDPANNTSPISPTLMISIDATAPSVPTITVPSTGQPITGISEANSTVIVTTPSGSTCTTTADAGGNYSCSLTPAPVDGEDITVIATDASGNTSLPAIETGGIDTSIPTPSIDSVSQGDDEITGTGEVGSTIVIDGISCDESPITVAVDGTWTCSNPSPEINYNQAIIVTATDGAGNTGTASYTTPEKPSSSRSSVRFICEDPIALNYDDSGFGRHEQSKCEYKTTAQSTPTETNPFGGEQCPAQLIITDNMKQGDRDGQYGSYNQEIVTQIHLLQTHMNRLLLGEYGNQASGPVDGIFGPLTKRGVKRLQIRLNQLLPNMAPLVIDGIVGPFTKAAINMSC